MIRALLLLCLALPAGAQVFPQATEDPALQLNLEFLYDRFQSIASSTSTATSASTSTISGAGTAADPFTANPSSVTLNGNYPGQIIRSTNVYTNAVTTITQTIAIPFDDSVPQSNEGVQFPTLYSTYTAVNANSDLFIDAIVYAGFRGNSNSRVVTVFVDAASSATASCVVNGVADSVVMAAIPCHARISPVGSGSHTYKLRVGDAGSADVILNGGGAAGSSPAQSLGRTIWSSIHLEEKTP